jgi:integrase/recombinase XerD
MDWANGYVIGQEHLTVRSLHRQFDFHAFVASGLTRPPLPFVQAATGAMDLASFQPDLFPEASASRRLRRNRKRAFYRKCGIPPAAPRADPLARNPMREELDAYLEYWRLMGYREAGVVIRQKALKRFVTWADARGLRSVTELTLPLLERYQRDLFLYRKADGMPLAMSSQQLLLVPVKGFFRWLARTGRIPFDPAAGLVLPRKPARLPVRVLSIAEVERMIGESDITAPWGVRDRAILEVLYSTGMRRSELAGLTVHDWDRVLFFFGFVQGFVVL